MLDVGKPPWRDYKLDFLGTQYGVGIRSRIRFRGRFRFSRPFVFPVLRPNPHPRPPMTLGTKIVNGVIPSFGFPDTQDPIKGLLPLNIIISYIIDDRRTILVPRTSLVTNSTISSGWLFLVPYYRDKPRDIPTMTFPEPGFSPFTCGFLSSFFFRLLPSCLSF